ncbi:MAG TPA: TrmH family RNA methyltransferase, partial [Pseudonocardiaceae bacterium]
MQLRARDGRALLAGSDDEAAAEPREVDPHNLALGAELADALHEWARVADAVPLHEAAAPGRRTAILLGAEGHGLTDEALAAADERVRIPMANDVDSLNVATAAAIAFH